jgi:phage terminase small subunit
MKSSATQLRPPKLSGEAKRWWTQIVAGFEIEDEAGLLILRTAMESLDRLREAQSILARDGIITTDRFGQQRQHPATLIERDARTLMRSLKALNLDVVPPGPIGRPPGSGKRAS